MRFKTSNMYHVVIQTQRHTHTHKHTFIYTETCVRNVDQMRHMKKKPLKKFREMSKVAFKTQRHTHIYTQRDPFIHKPDKRVLKCEKSLLPTIAVMYDTKKKTTHVKMFELCCAAGSLIKSIKKREKKE
jgi:hypothetical protein